MHDNSSPELIDFNGNGKTNSLNRTASLAYPSSNLLITINHKQTLKKNSSLASAPLKQERFKKFQTKTSDLLEKLAKTEEDFEKNEKRKNFEAYRSRNSQKFDDHLSISRKTLKLNLDHVNEKSKIEDLFSPSNHHSSVMGSRDYHILKNFKTFTTHRQKENSNAEEYYSSLTKANLDKYIYFFKTYNKIEGKQIKYMHQGDSLITKNENKFSQNISDNNDKYFINLKEKDMNGIYFFFTYYFINVI